MVMRNTFISRFFLLEKKIDWRAECNFFAYLNRCVNGSIYRQMTGHIPQQLHQLLIDLHWK